MQEGVTVSYIICDPLAFLNQRH